LLSNTKKIILSIFLFFLFFEAINGSWYSSKLEKKLLEINAIYDVDIKIDPNDFYESKNKISYKRNKFGLRDNCKNTKNIAIVTVGGSTTDQRYIDFEKTFQKRLQDFFRSSNIDTCISNAGVDGHTSFGSLKAVQDWFPLIPDFNPRYFILYTGINDAVLIEHNGKLDSKKSDIFTSIKFKLISNSYLYFLYNKCKNIMQVNNDTYGVLTHTKEIKKLYKFDSQTVNPIFKNDLFENSIKFKENFTQIINLIIKSGSEPICVSQPTFFVKEGKGITDAIKYKGSYLNGLDLNLSLDLINNEMKEICKKNNLIFIDISNEDFLESDFYDFVHLNNQGNEKIANILFNSLKDKINF
jgi:lysophospholipase L1-like esterase